MPRPLSPLLGPGATPPGARKAGADKQANPFAHPAFKKWAEQFPASASVLDPYAGSLSLIPLLREQGLAAKFAAYDIEPGAPKVTQRDTVADFPTGHSVCITHPPDMSRSAAAKAGADFGDHDNLWKLATSLCLDNCEYVAAIVPETFIASGAMTKRLQAVVALGQQAPGEAEGPSCLALWGPEDSATFTIWQGSKKLGTHANLLAKIDALLPAVPKPASISFNEPKGKIGLKAVDNPMGPSIVFGPAALIPLAEVKPNSRSHTRILVDTKVPADVLMGRANRLLAKYRQITADVFLAPHYGLRNDGRPRRRLDWATARRILEVAESTDC